MPPNASIYDNDNKFAKILNGKELANIVYEDEQVIALLDKFPEANVHVLVIPKGKYTCFQDFVKQRAGTGEVEHFFWAVEHVAQNICRLGSSGYRIIMNNGKDSNATIAHYHVHILGGNNLGPQLGSYKTIVKGANQGIKATPIKCKHPEGKLDPKFKTKGSDINLMQKRIEELEIQDKAWKKQYDNLHNNALEAVKIAERDVKIAERDVKKLEKENEELYNLAKQSHDNKDTKELWSKLQQANKEHEKLLKHNRELQSEMSRHQHKDDKSLPRKNAESAKLKKQDVTLEDTTQKTTLKHQKDSLQAKYKEQVNKHKILKDLLTRPKKESLLFGVPQKIKQIWNNQGIVNKLNSLLITIFYIILLPIIVLISLFGVTIKIESEMNSEQVDEFVIAQIQKKNDVSCSLDNAEIGLAQQENIAEKNSVSLYK